MILANGTPDKVQSRAVGNLHVIVIGGGIAGLSAAVSLRQQGHKVDVYEQSLLSNEVGAAIHMTPNATGVLKQIGVDPEDSGAVHLVQVRVSFGAHWGKQNDGSDDPCNRRPDIYRRTTRS